MTLKFFNTLTRQEEDFRSLRGKRVGMYTCGPTVYNYAHIGNLRSYVFADILKRVLDYNGFKVKQVMNITDVDDKTIRDSRAKYPELDPMAALKKFTAEYENYFWADLKKLNIEMPQKITHATEYIKEMQKLVKRIFKAGFGYIKEGSAYFDLQKYIKSGHKYGNLINIDFSGFKAGARGDADEYEKENVRDFVLWKGRKDCEPAWDFKLNGENLPGRPGWHIECSAMGEAELGCPFDIHTGGIDLKFPHHENEIAQSAAGYGADRPVNFWLHNEHLLIDGQRMGKRFNNFYTVKDLEAKGFGPLAYRYLCLQTHYGKPMNFTWEALQAAGKGLDNLKQLAIKNYQSKIKIGKIDEEFKERFLAAVDDNLNLAEGLAILQEVLKSDLAAGEKLATILDFDRVLGLGFNDLSPVIEENVAIRDQIDLTLLPREIKELAGERLVARQNKDWARSDELRVQIEAAGFAVEDEKSGYKIKKK